MKQTPEETSDHWQHLFKLRLQNSTVLYLGTFLGLLSYGNAVYEVLAQQTICQSPLKLPAFTENKEILPLSV